VPLKQVCALLNMDMVGRLRDNRVFVYGARTGAGFHRLAALQNRDNTLFLDFNWEIKADSDHHPFFSQGIPFLMLHTGLHPDYHRPSDDAEKVNSEGIRLVSRLAFDIVLEWADGPQPARFRTASRSEGPDTQRRLEQPLPALPARFGVSWDDKDRSAPGLRVTQVTPGLPAAKAGLRAGDRILKFADQDVADGEEFRALVVAAKNPVAMTIQRPGEAAPQDLPVTLAGEPLRIGITWRTDDAEPGSVFLNRVAPGSAADRAGLKTGDRVYSIHGHEFATSDEFFSLLTTLPSPLELQVERRGQMRTVELPLPPQ
jgi:membrane-associated protease RseP (regulator of RpoE activity)